MATQKPTGKTPEKAAEKASEGRTVHLLVRTGESGAIVELENFTAELAARRELDNRPSWQYLGVRPGVAWQTNELGGISS